MNRLDHQFDSSLSNRLSSNLNDVEVSMDPRQLDKKDRDLGHLTPGGSDRGAFGDE